MTTRADLLTEARTWLGTPWAHYGSTLAAAKGVAVDCIGVVREPLRACGLLEAAVQTYARIPDGASLMATTRQYLQEIDRADARAGDVLVFRWEAEPQHFGWLTRLSYGAPGVLHGYSVLGKVVEHRLDDKWLRRVYAAFRVPGLED